jgi:hypothetical protein
LIISRVEFTDPTPGRWYAAGIGLTDHDQDVAGSRWPRVSEADGRLVIDWPDGSADRIDPAGPDA